jgi:hypothetical protein
MASFSKLEDIKIRSGSCLVVMMLSLDWLNPVKVLGSVAGFDEEWLLPVVATLALGALFAVVYSNGKEISYHCTKIFFHSILHIFFSSIEVRHAGMPALRTVFVYSKQRCRAARRHFQRAHCRLGDLISAPCF